MNTRRQHASETPAAEMEHVLGEEQRTDRIVTLKTGFRMDAALASGLWMSFKAYLLWEHEKFLALRALIEGRPPDTSSEFMQAFKECGYLTDDGQPRPEVVEVFKAAFRETDGPCFVDPFLAREPEDVRKLKELKKLQEERRNEMMPERRRPSEGGLPPGRR